MANQIDYLPIGNAVGADVETQEEYAADTTLSAGYPTGIVPQRKFNKSWRQVSVMTAAVATYLSEQLASDIRDDGDVAALVEKIRTAIVVGANIKPAVIIPASNNFEISSNQYRIGIARTVAPAAISGQLPTLTDDQIGQEFVVEDLVGNFNAYPVTIVAPSGQAIVGRAQWVLNRDCQSAKFTWYGNNLWSVAT